MSPKSLRPVSKKARTNTEMLHIFPNPDPAKGRLLTKKETVRLPSSCIRAKCSVDVLDTCGICGGKVIRINHNQAAHFADDLKTGVMPSGSTATYDRQCIGKWHEFKGETS